MTTGADDINPTGQAGSAVLAGSLIVISSPSGAGKTTLTRRLLAADDQLRLSISATTRTPRPGESDGTDYYFWDRPRFEAERDAGGFLEHAVVFDHLYGTPWAPVRDWVQAGQDVVFDIDWQGARQLAAKPPAPLTTIFILPPSMAELEARLRARAGDPEHIIAKRMARAHDEISHWEEYDYVVVNDDLDQAEAALHAIIAAVRAGDTQTDAVANVVRSRPGLSDRVGALMAERA